MYLDLGDTFMYISNKKNTAKQCHAFWLRIKLFNNMIKCFCDNFDFTNPNEDYTLQWNYIESSIIGIYNFLYSEQVIIGLIGDDKKYYCLNKNEMWNHYELLVDSLQEFLLSREYQIIQNQETFINNLVKSLDFFENVLQSIILNE